MAKKFTSEELKQAVVEWQESHEIVSLVRRLVMKTGGVKEAKDAIDAIASADAFVVELGQDD